MLVQKTTRSSRTCRDFIFGIAVAGLVALVASDLRADLDKEDLDEKAKAELDGGGHDPSRPEHENLLDAGEKNLKEINRLLKEIQDQLANKQTGAATQAKQSDAVKKLEQLIKDLGKG